MTNEELLGKIEEMFATERRENKKTIEQLFVTERRENKKTIEQLFIDERKQTRKIIQEEITKETEPIKKELKKLDKRTLKTNRTLSFIAKFYDKEIVDTHKRLKNVERHLGLSDPTMPI